MWEEGELCKIQLKEERIQGNLIAVDDSRIQIEGYGEINRSINLPVYKIYGSVEEKNLSDIVIANMKVENSIHFHLINQQKFYITIKNSLMKMV